METPPDRQNIPHNTSELSLLLLTLFHLTSAPLWLSYELDKSLIAITAISQIDVLTLSGFTRLFMTLRTLFTRKSHLLILVSASFCSSLVSTFLLPLSSFTFLSTSSCSSPR